jgi:ADP-heptose:LPS heptosyltransferase
MIHIHSPEPLIGDCLAQLPFMCAVAEARGDRVRLTGGVNRHIAPLLEPLPIVFEPEGSGTGADFTLQVWPAYQTGLRTKLHMVQCYFHDFGWPVPAMPIALPFKMEPCGLPPGIVLSPFSGSDLGTNTKLWPHDRWVQVIQTLRRLGLAEHVYLLGTHKADSTEPYAVAGIEPVFDRPLTQVLDLMRQAPLVLTIDTGTGHLAHLGSIKHHVMIYADCQPPIWAEAPRATIVRGPKPANISVDQVLEAARQVLEAPCQVKVFATC